MATYRVELPDGRTVRIEAASPQDADKAAGEYLRAKPPKPSAGRDFMRPVKGAWDKFTGDIRDDYDRAQKAARGEVKPTAKSIFENSGAQMAGNVFNLAMAPFQGALESVVTRPAARGLIGAGLPVYERQNIFAIPEVPPQRITGQDAEDAVAGDLALGLAGARAAPVRAPRPVPRVPPRQRPAPADVLAERANLDPVAMQARADEMRASGIQPTPTDVAGDRGRRVIRAVGVRSEVGGETLANRAAEATATTKPATMGAARRLNPDRRTATQFADEMEEARGTQAGENYAQFDADQIEVPDTVRDMLADSSGRSIIARARADAIENQDWGRQVELDRLLQAGDQGGVGPLPRISAGTIDRLVIAARERGATFARRGNNNRARGAFNRRNQLDATLDTVEGLRPARQTYANQSRAIEVARGENRMDPFSTDPADYQAWVGSLPEEARQANQIAIRQEILDTLGGQRAGGSLGTLDDIATSPYARENLRAAFGPEVADRFIGEVAARLAQTRNAQMVNPNSGSRTAVLEQDVGNTAQETVGAVRQGLSGDLIGLAARAADAWRRRGIRPEVAEEIARLAVDPNATDAAIQAAAARLAPQERRQLLQLRAAVVRMANAAPAIARPAAATLPATNLSASREAQRTAPRAR